MTLLAIDLGLRAGLAWYGTDGRLLRYRSTHFASTSVLKRGLERVLDEQEVSFVYVEGDRRYGELWGKRAEKRGAAVVSVAAETWRTRLRVVDKEHADEVARRVIEWSGAKRPTSLRHDAAEAILIGLYGVLDVGWLDERTRPT